jgi:hypothetical protein
MSYREPRSIDFDAFPTEAVSAAASNLPSGIEAMAEQVRQIYCMICRVLTKRDDFGKEAIPRWDGGRDPYGRHWKSVWPKIAKHLITIQADPLDFIQAQFNGVSPDSLPFPNTFWSEKATNRYRAYMENACETLQRALEFETQAIRAQAIILRDGLDWTNMAAMRQAIVTEHGVHASPLMRFCLADEYGLEDVAALYHDAALLQYVFRRDIYDEVWGKCIPDSLRTEGADLADRMLLS